jgi:hypothetical protein
MPPLTDFVCGTESSFAACGRLTGCVEDAHDLCREAALGPRRRALHVQHDLVLLHLKARRGGRCQGVGAPC